MAKQIEMMSADVELVSKLGDQPNQENGLTAEELKAVFDRGSKRLKEYVNETLVPAVNELAESDGRSIKNDQLPKAINAALDQAKESGEFDGGYYVPIVDQTNASAMRIEFAPSDKGAMPPVEPVRIELPPGPRGATGKTAYAYAKEGGYTGTEEEFAAKLAAEMPDALPNPAALVIDGKAYYGHMMMDMTDTINGMIDAKGRILLWDNAAFHDSNQCGGGSTVTVSEMGEEYSGVEVLFYCKRGGSLVSSGFIPIDTLTPNGAFALGVTPNGELVTRTVRYSRNVFTFGAATIGAETDNKYLLPWRIYGYK